MDNIKINLLESKIKKNIIKLKIIISKETVRYENMHTKNLCLSQLSTIYDNVNIKNNLENIATNEIPMLVCNLIQIKIQKRYLMKSLEYLSNMIDRKSVV